jgi:Ca-activated chloride channel family protein
MSLTFDNPVALWLLLLVPAFFLVARLGVAYLSRPVRNAAIAVRLALVTTLVLALAQPVLHRGSDLLSVVFLVDRSASVSVKGTSAAEAWLQQALRQVPANDHTAVIDFASTAVVRQGLGVDHPNTGVPTPDPSQTNLGQALHLASALFPSTGARRVVVLSDGQTNAGDAQAQAREASTRGIQVDVVPIGPPAGFREVMLESLTVPPDVRTGQTYDVSAVVGSTTATSATLRFQLDGKAVSQGTVKLQPGANRFSITLPAAVKGFHTYQATVSSPNDTYAQNNTAYAFTDVHPAGTVAVVASNPLNATAIVSALKSARIQVALLAPSAIPPTLSAMSQYDALVLVDTPATAFTLDQMKTIAGFAHDLGHGLVVIGGQQSYGQGKYDGTPLGDALPVVSGVPGNLQNGNVALTIVIDKSGSMEEDEGGVQKMAMADKSAQLAIQQLQPNDQISVVTFDTDPTVVVPLQDVGSAGHSQQLQGQVGQIQASGGTDIFAGLQAGYNQIHQSNARYKHIILMSDGNSLVDSNYAPLLQKLQAEKITLSAIAIGSDADQNLMRMLAKQGGGTFYYVSNAAQIPQITVHETQVVRGSAKVNAAFQPQIAAPSPLLESFSGSELPQLSGYVVTTPQRNATVALQSDRRDPVLAQWNYGLGRVVAWTSDLTSHWAASWLAWPHFAAFWSQVVNWSMRAPGDPYLQSNYTVNGKLVTFSVDVVNDQGAFQNLLDLRARVTGADGQPVEVPLTQTRPGHYEAQFSISQPGAYPVEVLEYNSQNQVVRDDTTGVVVSYPAEYRDFGVNQDTLATLAATTGGTVLHSPSDAFNPAGLRFTGQDALNLWSWLLGLAVILFPIDVAVRRLRIDPVHLAGRTWTGGRGRLGDLARWLGQSRRRLGRGLRRSLGLAGMLLPFSH